MQNPDFVPDDDPELVAIIGANLLPQFGAPARSTLKWEASKHPAGVARVVRDVLADPSIRNPCAIILHRVVELRQHLDATPPPAARVWPPPFRPPPGERTCPTCHEPVFGAPRSRGSDACPTCGRAGANATPPGKKDA